MSTAAVFWTVYGLVTLAWSVWVVRTLKRAGILRRWVQDARWLLDKLRGTRGAS